MLQDDSLAARAIRLKVRHELGRRLSAATGSLGRLLSGYQAEGVRVPGVVHGTYSPFRVQVAVSPSGRVTDCPRGSVTCQDPTSWYALL
jgi:hypothetical protein